MRQTFEEWVLALTDEQAEWFSRVDRDLVYDAYLRAQQEDEAGLTGILGDCPYDNCGMPYSLEDERLFPSSDPTGYSVAKFYRCLADHRWQVAAGAGVPLDGEEV